MLLGRWLQGTWMAAFRTYTMKLQARSTVEYAAMGEVTFAFCAELSGQAYYFIPFVQVGAQCLHTLWRSMWCVESLSDIFLGSRCVRYSTAACLTL